MQEDDNQKLNSDLGPNLVVSISINDITVQFSGSSESVLSSVMTFISKHVPTLDLAKRISLNYSTTELIEQFGNFVKITPEGPMVDVSFPHVKLSDKQVVVLYLVAMKIAKELGKAENEKSSIPQIQSTTALNPKSISPRLSELVKSGHVIKETNKNGSQIGLYIISTAGIHWLASSISKKSPHKV